MEENIAQKILNKDIENIVKKVAQGKTLTEAERARIENTYNVESSKEVLYVGSLVELAEILGVSRMTLDRWRKKKGAPKTLSNGKHCIKSWRDFTRSKGLKTILDDEESALKSRKLLAEVRQAEIKLKVMEETYVSVEKVREVWTMHIGQARAILESRFLNELPPLLMTLNAIQIRERMQEVLDEVYRAMQEASKELKDVVIED